MRRTPENTKRVADSHHECANVPVMVEIARFCGQSGVEEIHLIARPLEYGPFDVQLDWLRRASDEVFGAESDSVVLRRFFCSDLSNQAAALGACSFSRRTERDGPCAVSWVGQPPAGAAKVVLWAYHINDPRGAIEKCQEGDTLTLRRGSLSHHWTCGVASPGKGDASEQTRQIFATYEAFLRAHALHLAENVVRTWIFVRDIDNDYGGLVDARREYFAQRGLTPDTHYIASSGIQGACVRTDARVGMDAYALSSVQPGQVAYIRAPDHLSPTDVYGVTFERGATVAYRDRKHVVISGTASIGRQGQLLHGGDVARQLERTLENIEALLQQAGAGRADMSMLIAYLRDPSDADVVRRGMRDRFGDTPLVVLTAPVCRPAWLVEVEGLAIVPATNPTLPAF